MQSPRLPTTGEVRAAIFTARINLDRLNRKMSTYKAAGWVESDHPRGDDGKFSDGGSGQKKKPSKWKKMHQEVYDKHVKNGLPKDKARRLADRHVKKKRESQEFKKRWKEYERERDNPTKRQY